MANHTRAFNPKTFLSTVGLGRKMMSFHKGQTIYAQGHAADALFVIQEGTVKLAAKSQTGKEAILDVLGDGDLVGKDSVAGQFSRTETASKVGKPFLAICVSQKYAIPAGSNRPTLQPQREEAGAYSFAARPL